MLNGFSREASRVQLHYQGEPHYGASAHREICAGTVL